jgi:CRP/FNR family transcriptional regulator, cyclic AMP receptor protein
MPCNPAELAKVNFFELLDEDDLQAVAEVVRSKTLDGSEILFHAGEPGEEMFIVKSGEVELFIKDTTGQKIVLTVAGENDLFGELAMLDNKPRSATAMALTETELLVLNREDLTLLFQKKPDTALSMLASMSGMLRKTNELIKTRVSRNVNEEIEEKSSALERIADWIAWFSGSMPFLFLNITWFMVWIAINVISASLQFDPFPFGFLTMIVSLESIFLACFLLISQNRQAEKDRVRGDIEYEVNIKAEMEIAHLHEKTDRIYEQMLERFSHLEKSLSQK